MELGPLKSGIRFVSRGHARSTSRCVLSWLRGSHVWDHLLQHKGSPDVTFCCRESQLLPCREPQHFFMQAHLLKNLT